MKFDRVLEILAVVLIAVVLVGEVVVYTTGQDSYSSNAEVDGDVLSYSVGADGSECYSVIVMDNGDMSEMTEVYIYYDDSYMSNYEEVEVAIGAKSLDQDYYIEQLVKQLDYSGAVTVTILNAEELAEALQSDIDCGDYTKGLIVISGALPDTVYTGESSNLIFTWMEDGGRLYWLGNLIGSCYATQDSLITVEDYQMLFFGVECLNTGDTEGEISDVSGNDLRYYLSLSNDSVEYGIDVDALISVKGSDDVLALGYYQDGYASIVMTSYGEGMICVIGGEYSDDQRGDLVQVVCSQVCYTTEVVTDITGSVTRETITGEYDLEGFTGNIAVYIYLGGYYPVHGDFYMVRDAD